MKLSPALIVVVLLVPTIGLIVAAGCRTAPGRVAINSLPGALPEPAIENHFVGNEACSPCHSKEFEAHKKSFHSQTARLTSEIGKIVLPKGAILGSHSRLRPDGKNIRVSIGDSQEGAETLTHAFGSGKTGITFVAFTGDRALFEMRSSYFPRVHRWYCTPGHEKLAPDEMGLDYPVEPGRQCVGCHATTLSATTIVPERRFLGVGCEACHGPGSAHIAAASRNDTAHLGMVNMSRLGGKKLNSLCGRCHRTEEDIIRSSPQLITETQRFQSFGIMKSRCFKESNDSLKCITCHNPHTNASTDNHFYENTCLKCHGARSSNTPRSNAAPIAKACPVNSQNGCIPCHMPARKILPHAERSPFAVDHFIHINRSK